MSITDMLKEGAEAAKEIAEDIVEKAEDVIGKVLGDDEPTCMELATAMYQMMGEGKMLEAFDKYYHDDVVMIEATGDVREGKETNRKFEEQWLASVKELHGGGVQEIALGFGVADDTLAHLPGQVQPKPLLFQALHDP